MRVGGAAAGGFELVPFGTSRTPQSRHAEVEAIDPGADTRAGFSAAFATQRHPYVRAEQAPRHRGSEAEAARRREQTRPQGAFLAQFIAQERLGDGLAIDRSAEQVHAYRRASRPLVEIRGGATVDVAA